MIIIQFDYEIERDPNITGSLLWDILPTVEAHLTNLLIQALIPVCNNNRRLRSYQAHNSRSLGELFGVSSSPIDMIVGAAECQSNVAEGSVCAPIRGGISLFLEGASEGEAYAAQSSIKTVMDKDLLLSAHDAILKVIYMSRVQIIMDEGNDDIDLNADDDTEFWRTGLFKGIMLGVFSGLLTMIGMKFVVTRDNKRELVTSSNHEITEVRLDSSYCNSSDSTTTSDDETVLASNKMGRNAVQNDEMGVDIDIENVDEYPNPNPN